MFSWSGYLALAEELARRDEEACKRAAISRAYYAAFCTARNLLARRQLIDLARTGEDHVAVWKALRNHQSRRMQELSPKGFSLLRRRRNADYDDECTGLDESVQAALRESRFIVETLAKV